jgi:hypothetical protein
MSSYVNILENIANPISELVLSNMKFYLLKNQSNGKGTIIATLLPQAELNRMIDDFRIYKDWDVEDFINWIREMKAIKVYKIDLHAVQIKDF